MSEFPTIIFHGTEIRVTRDFLPQYKFNGEWRTFPFSVQDFKPEVLQQLKDEGLKI